VQVKGSKNLGPALDHYKKRYPENNKKRGKRERERSWIREGRRRNQTITQKNGFMEPSRKKRNEKNTRSLFKKLRLNGKGIVKTIFTRRTGEVSFNIDHDVHAKPARG